MSWLDDIPTLPGVGIIRVSWVGTILFAIVAVVAAIFPDEMVVPVIAVSGALFLVGVVAFLWGFLTAVGRSREVLIGIGGLYFLSGCAPNLVQRLFMVALGVQVVVALVLASIGLAASTNEPVAPLAFGTLAPMYGLGLSGLWGARYGVFPERTENSDNGTSS